MKIGEILDKKYKIIKVLGMGGMSAVYLAENMKLGTLWAIKEINKNSHNKIDLFVEPNILKKLNHPALPRVFDIFEDETSMYFVMDYIEGSPLSIELSKVGKFEEKQILLWARQICEVLNYLHEIKPNPIIYRDMKPSNIILTRQGTIKLIDFGIAREFKYGLSDDTIYLGTKGYAAPEQYGLGQSNVTTDIYSLGVTLLNLLTGESPDKSIFILNDEKQTSIFVSYELKLILKKCTQINSKDRYQSVEGLLIDINSLLSKDDINLNIKKSTIHQNEINSRGFATFKRLVVTILGNSEFACELAYISAKLTNFRVLLADFDMINPSVDIYLNLKESVPANEYIYEQNSGLIKFLNSADRNSITEAAILKEVQMRKELKNLKVLTGCINMDNNMIIPQENVSRLIEKAYQSFDLTILSVNKSVFDPLTITALEKSDYNIAAIRADVDVLREYERYTSFLFEDKQINIEKNKFVAFEYDENINLRKDALKNFYRRNFIGFIRYSKKRQFCRNLKVPYAKRMEKQVVGDYLRILSFFDIVPESSIFNRINNWLFGKKEALI